MRTIPTFTCLVLLTLVAPAARAESFRTDINPALIYYRALLLTPDPSPADRDYLFTTNWQGQTLPEPLGKLLAGYDHQFELIRVAAHQKVPCDWGIDMSPGPNTLLPHLNRVRAVARTARLRAMWDLQHGDQAGARDDLLAAFVFARNVSRDDILISALVQIAMEGIVYDAIMENFGQFSPETLQQLADGFDAAPAPGTMANAIATTEARDVTDWMENRVLELRKKYPGNDAKLLENLGPQMDDTNLWPRVVKAAGGTSDGFLKLVRDLKPLYQRLVAIMTLPPPEYEDQIQKFEAAIRESPNPLAQSFLLGYVAARQKEFTIQAEEAMVRAAVQYKLHGEAGLKSVMDPFGKGPFAFQRFVFEGVDRGFELKSAYNGRLAWPSMLIFVEKAGPPFYVEGPPDRIGHAVKP